MKTNARRKFIATLLALSLILTGFPGTAVWAQSGGTDQTEKQAAAVSSEQPVSHVASVDSSGKITARRLGQATITASVGTDTATCVVTVKIPDGVYYIKSATSGFCLGTSGSIANGTITTLQSRTTTDPQRIFQLWQVTHLENGVCYSIQPLNKTSMMLTSPNSAAEIREISSDDSGTAASTYSKWYLSGNWLDGFLFKANNSGAKYLQPNEDDPSTGTHVITEEYDSAGINVYKYYWDLEQVTGVSGFLLYDGTNFVAGTPPIKYAVKEKSYTLLDFGLHIYTYGENANQTLTWICRNAKGDTVSSDIFTAYQEGNTYRIRINAVGTYTVTGTNAFGSKSFHVEVIPLEDGTYYIQSPSSEKHLEYGSDHNASVYQDWICGGSSQKWILTHRGDGTYSIQSAGSTNGNYLEPASSVAEGQSVTCQSTNYGWKIVEDQQTAGSYGILLATNTTLAATLASNSSSSGVGLALNRHNLNDLSLSDEWRLLKEGPDVLLVGILDTSSEAHNHDHTTTISTSIPQFRQKGYKSFRIIISEGMSTADLQSALADAQIFISRSHGNVTNNSTYLLLSPEEPAPPMTLDTSDIYDFSTGTVITDMSNCDLAIFPNCFSAAHLTQSLVDAAVAAGADVAAGFAEELACPLISDWFNSFFTYYNPEGTVNEGAQLTVVEALHRASADNEDGGFDSIRVVYR